jgi:hypothetical protein
VRMKGNGTQETFAVSGSSCAFSKWLSTMITKCGKVAHQSRKAPRCVGENQYVSSVAREHLRGLQES